MMIPTKLVKIKTTFLVKLRLTLLIDLLVPFKVLIRDGEGVLYTVQNEVINEETGECEDALVTLEETEVSSFLFKTRGFQKLPVRISAGHA